MGGKVKRAQGWPFFPSYSAISSEWLDMEICPEVIYAVLLPHNSTKRKLQLHSSDSYILDLGN